MDNRTSSSLGLWLKQGTGRAFNWLLDKNRPVKKLDDQEFSAEVEHNYRWNYVFNVLDGATFWFGASFYSLTTIGPLFISKLTDNPVPLGILAIISQAGWAFPQLFAANSTERLGRMKPLVVRVGFLLERLPMFVMFLAAIIAVKSPLAALVVYILGAAWHSVGAGVIAPAWQTMLARIIPVERRGRFMAFTMFLGAGTGLIGTQVSAWLLDTQPFPKNFFYLFLIAAFFINLSWVFIAFTREPIPARQAPPADNNQYAASLKKIIREDVNFRRFLIARGFTALAGMGTGFVTVAAIQRWAVPDSTVGYYTMTILVGQTVANLLLGWLADKYGHKLPLELGTLGVTLAFALAWLAPTPGWYFVVFGLLGFNMSAFMISGIMLVMEFCEPERVPTYTGLANTLIGSFGILAPMIGTVLAGFSYPLLFGLSAGFSLIGLLALRFWVQEPRWAAKAEAAPEIGEA